MLICKNLSFQYSESKKFDFPEIYCPDSDTLLILGQSGKGKTTLLHLLALLLKPKTGTIEINNKAIEQFSTKDAARFRAENIGIVYQKPHFVASLSVEDNLLLPNYLANQKLNKERINTLAESLGFTEHLAKKTHQLSLGEQQRVSIARALMNNPRLVLADEPTSSLDDENCQKVVELLKDSIETIGASLVIVTHDQRLKSIFKNQIQL
jgi:lipoprotein-releasing system ATP-binding protein